MEAGGKIYVGLGDILSSNLNDFWAYDIATDTWQELTVFPSDNRHHPFYFSIGKDVYVGMGHGSVFVDGWNVYRDFYKYDTATDTWTRMNDFPGEARVAGTQFTNNGKGYVLHGEGEDHDLMDDGEFWEYDPSTDSWQQLTSVPGGSRWAPGTFVVDNTVYTVAGSTLNNYFAEYFSYFYGHPDEFLIEVKVSDGSKQAIKVEGLPKSDIRAIRSKKYPNRVTVRGINQKEGDGIILNMDTLKNTAILTIRDFDSNILQEVHKQDFKKTLMVMFYQIRQSQAKNLIIDLRGNQGGNLENGIFLLSNILNQNFSVVDQFYVVKKPEAKTETERNRIKRSKGTGSYSPTSQPFKGDTYLLVNGESFSNSGIVSSAFRNYKRGKIIGEETGGNKNVICGWGEIITLPNTRISVHIPTKQFVISGKDKNDGHGVIPDFIVRPTISELIKGRDEVMDFTLNLIQK